MPIDHIHVFVEEPSLQAALECLLPKILKTITFEIHPFQGKQDMLKKLPSRLRAYRKSLRESSRIIVLIDRDSEDCYALKDRLESIAQDAGLQTKSSVRDQNYQVLNRIIIEELEAWYFGDWNAVRKAYPKVKSTIPQRKSLRNCDAITGGTWEAFERIMKQSGYFMNGLRKMEAARTIAKEMEPDRNNSPSFQAFYQTLRGWET